MKRGVVIYIVDMAFKICSQEFPDSKILYLKDILFCSGYPVKFINELIEDKAIKCNIKVTLVSESPEFNLSKSLISLPYF